MTTVVYPLGNPPAAALRGGDCRARDLTQQRNIYGPGHHFAATTDCQISNGLLRLTVGATGGAPSITVDAWRPAVGVGDIWSDTWSDTWPGTTTTAAWQAMGVVTIDSPAVSALLTAVRLVRVSGDLVILRLVAPLMADSFVVLPRGFRSFLIQHGSPRPPFVTTTRRVRWTASPSPTGTATTNRVEEQTPVIQGFPRFLGALSPVTIDAGAFSLTSPSLRSVTYTAGIGTDTDYDRVADHHGQAANASRGDRVLV